MGKLIEAIENGEVKEALSLIDKRVGLNEKDDDSGDTPLHSAAAHNYVDIAEKLLLVNKDIVKKETTWVKSHYT